MQKFTKRSLIAGAAIAAAGLFGSLPYTGATMAQQGVPTVHQEVALVDAASAAVDYTPLLGVEGAFNTTLDNGLVADNGLLDVLYTAVGPTLSVSLLGTDGSGAIYSSFGGEYLDVFNGAAASGYNGFISNTLAFEAELNNILGVPVADSQAYLLDQFQDLFIGAVPGTLGDPSLGDGFIGDLTAIANASYTIASNDLTGYFGLLFANYDDVITGVAQLNLSDLLTDVTGSLAALTTGLTDNVNDLVNAIIGLF